MGQLADEADGVAHQVAAGAQLDGAHRRVERLEQPVAHAHGGPLTSAVLAGQRVQQRQLAGVRVAHERHGRQRRALALRAHHPARALDVLEPAPQRRDAVARQAPVRLDLALSRAPRPDPAAEALEVAPQAAHAREVVFELGQLDLQLALGARSVVGEDVEDDRRAVDHRQPQRLFEIALLACAQLIVAGDQIGVERARELLGLTHLARAEIAVGMGVLTPLDQLAHDRDTGGAQQLAELGQLALVRIARRCTARADAPAHAARCDCHCSRCAHPSAIPSRPLDRRYGSFPFETDSKARAPGP